MIMADNINCPLCNGIANLIEDEIVNRLYKCSVCGNDFFVRVHYVDVPVPLEAKVFKAFVHLENPSMVRIFKEKVKKVFLGKSNFSLGDLDRQIQSGVLLWDLGYYSGEEIQDLTTAAENIELTVDFRLE